MNRTQLITNELLDRYVAVNGELERLPDPGSIDPELWEIIDQLLLDLHMIRHDYTTDGYAKFVERRLHEVCASEAEVLRMKEIRL